MYIKWKAKEVWGKT